jgi:hypothetical protein
MIEHPDQCIEAAHRVAFRLALLSGVSVAGGSTEPNDD